VSWGAGYIALAGRWWPGWECIGVGMKDGGGGGVRIGVRCKTIHNLERGCFTYLHASSLLTRELKPPFPCQPDQRDESIPIRPDAF
jgi:hypothetical protein